ncbi:hypothetical protein [Chondromyces apiculatus]|uniref:Uncharacterized protein n=1 Tax=Chondromyces apiculatus DSM 436 TaxID=1192034 RepID=A0A017SUM2_9BACT|nr:hypothetical protein [Chondromyces apiculatus]EYE99980.1 Hypothetical protein CAP_1866 [Chondromyces apiculatus DSM 436]
MSWGALGDRAGDVNFLLEWLEQLVVRGVGSVDVMVVNTRMYNLRSRADADRRRAFDVSCTRLFQSIARKDRCGVDVFIKRRPGASLHQPAAVEVIGNHMLRRISSRGELQSVSEVAAAKVFRSARDRHGLDSATGEHACKETHPNGVHQFTG